jgi:hypothetical protein
MMFRTSLGSDNVFVIYAAAYARAGRMHAAWEYFFSFRQAAKDFAEA